MPVKSIPKKALRNGGKEWNQKNRSKQNEKRTILYLSINYRQELP